MSIDTEKYKPRLREYLQKKGVHIKTEERPNRISCPSPNHADVNPTACIYDDNHIVFCPVCHESWDVFEVAGLLIGAHTTDFPAKRDEVLHTLGESEPEYSPPPRQKTKPKPESKMKPLPLAEAQKIFTKASLLKIANTDADKKGWGTNFVAAWAYKNARGEVEVVDARFEGGEREKTVVSFFYDGQKVSWSQCPVVVYNRDKIAADQISPILVVEGAKSADGSKVGLKGAESMVGFIATTWNGGTGKIHLADWSCLKGREVYFYPDDDQKYYPDTARDHAGELKPPIEQPGIKAAYQLWEIGQRIGFDVIICQPYTKAREIKPDGADIIEALQILSPAAMAEYILAGPKIDPTTLKVNTGRRPDLEIESPKDEKPKATKKEKPPAPPEVPRVPPELSGLPFRILGCDDKSQAYFIDRSGHLQIFRLSQLTKTQLMMIAAKDWWRSNFSTSKGGVAWDDATDFIIEIAGQIDFNPDNLRGRGAWREPDGRICYHDGHTTTGEYAPGRLFIKKTARPIGIGTEPASPEIRNRIFELACQMSFESKVDVLRCLSWAVLAPFGGALTWRNAIMITGPSSSGKTAIADLLVNPIAHPKMYSGATSTEAGIRQDSPNDSEPIAIEEADPDTVAKKKNREAQLTLMRESTSENTPTGAKGTIDGKGMTYRLRKMFCFIAISPDIESWADENRINLVNLKEPTHSAEEWLALKKEIQTAVTPEVCAGIRAATWEKLPAIMAMADWLTDIVQEISGKNTRQSYSESMLLAAYVVVWLGHDEITEDQARDMIGKFYANQEPAETRDEADEMFNRIMDELVMINSDKFPRGMKMPMREILDIVLSGQIDSADDTAVNGKRPTDFKEKMIFKKTAQQYGITVTEECIAISQNHHEIRRILQRGPGYHKVLARHKKCVGRGKNVSMGTGSSSPKCIIFGVEKIPF